MGAALRPGFVAVLAVSASCERRVVHPGWSAVVPSQHDHLLHACPGFPRATNLPAWYVHAVWNSARAK